jgi:hypothetical protein
MRTTRVWAALLIAATACSNETEPAPTGPDPSCAAGCDPRGQPPVYEGTNAIDAVMTRVFWENDVTPVEATTAELCRRMTIDLTGRAPTADAIEADCGGKTPEQIARALQARPDYLLRSERLWRDRLDVNDVVTDWRYSKALFALVDRLHRGEIRYDSFAVEVLTHPGFTSIDYLPDERVRIAFRAFLGRPATDAEAMDLASLTRPWLPIQQPDPDFPSIYRFHMHVLPVLCAPLFRCTASLLGGGELDLAGAGYDPIPYENLTPQQLENLRVFGRVIARQPIFWEAAADEILNRLLGWSDGGRFPREPGVLLPEVRQVLAEYLLETGDIPAAERMVLSSWLYRQSAIVEGEPDPDRPVWASGPVKPMLAEDWLTSAMTLSIDFGTCDPRYTDLFPYFLLYQYAQTASASVDYVNAEVQRLHQMQELRVPLYADPMSGYMYPDLRFTQLARLIGGCPGFQAQRTGPSGIAYSFTQESIAELLCQPGVGFGATPPGTPTIENVVIHQTRRLFGRSPEPEEMEAFIAAHGRATGEDANSIVSSVCVALLGSAEGLFY